MRFFYLLGLSVLLTGSLFLSFADDNEKPKYFKVSKHQANIYKEHNNPKSDIVRQTRQNEYLEIISAGESWIKVKVDGREGFIEARAGKVVKRKSVPIITFLLQVIILLGCAGGIVFYIKKQKGITPKTAEDDAL
ncbi:MAG: hypothetical protein LBI42_14005 [Chitinispirillales bacterium]|jgi:hypothetical protein|nr:hypothetical protein [Chitinispirillales bacterium]